MIGTIINAIWCAMVKVINAFTDHVLETIANAIAWIIALLPSLPIEFEPIQWGEFGYLIGYFIPVTSMMTHFTYMLLLVLMWFSVQHILRIVRAIR